MESEESKKTEGSCGWIPYLPKNIHPKDKPLLDISFQAVWTLSSCKSGSCNTLNYAKLWNAGYGIDELLSNNVEKYWQSDGPQPHTILLEFQVRARFRL